MMTHNKKAAGLASLLLCVSLWNVAMAEEPKPEANPKENPDPIAVIPLQGMVPDNLVIMGDGAAFSQYAMIADKSKRTLTIWKNEKDTLTFVKAVPMDIGKNGGDKTIRDDHKTPEGIYFPQTMLEGAGLDYNEYGVRAFPLDYPNFFDQRAKKTGSGIWLHAIPETKSLLRGSRGCVVVRNDIIKEISPLITLKKTPVIIEDEVNYVSPKEFEKLRADITAYLEKWRSAWENKDIDQYISMYGDDFKSMRMKRDQWKSYKEGLNKKYSYIKVKLSKPVFFTRNGEAILNFMQQYESDAKKDFGRKTLYLRRVGNEYKIVGEEWAPEDGGLIARILEDN
jgi:murein L,D-transpeptidase YafK